MLTSPHPIVTATAGPRPRNAHDGAPPAADTLPAAVDAGLQRLRNLTIADQSPQPSDLEHRLRTALGTSRSDRLGYIPARVACAHLAAGDVTEAYFALLVARDQLLSEPLQAGSTSSAAPDTAPRVRG